MLYSVMYWDGLLRFGVRAIRKTRESAEEDAKRLDGEDSRNLYWVSVVEDDGGIGAYLESGHNGGDKVRLSVDPNK